MKNSVSCCLRCRKRVDGSRTATCKQVHLASPVSGVRSPNPGTVLMAKARSLRQTGLSQTVSASGWGFLVQPLICQAPANTAAVSALAMLALSAAQKEKPVGQPGLQFPREHVARYERHPPSSALILIQREPPRPVPRWLRNFFAVSRQRLRSKIAASSAAPSLAIAPRLSQVLSSPCHGSRLGYVGLW